MATGAVDDDATDKPIPSSAIDQAKKAALAETGGGRVTETEVNDEESKYEVEVTLADGTQVDVQLDERFKVVGTESDGADEDGADDDTRGRVAMRATLAAACAAATLAGCGRPNCRRAASRCSSTRPTSAPTSQPVHAVKPGTRWVYREIGEDGESSRSSSRHQRDEARSPTA